MLSARGWWLLLAVLVQIVVSLLLSPRGSFFVTVLGLAVLVWFLGEWLLFALRIGRLTTAVRLTRELRDDRSVVDTLWAGRSFEVRARLTLSGWLGLPYVVAQDWLPFGVELTSGMDRKATCLTADEPIELRYRVRCPAPGAVRFEGVRLEIADLQGFFYFRHFLRQPLVVSVLPPLSDAEGRQRTNKRINLLPPPGIHRLLRPGSGSELLDLRDYRPGDPPKMIAWKVSARRNKLITKEFESEVPVRCTLLLDTSQAVRLGPPGQNSLTRLVEIAATVAQAAGGSRDLVGLALVDERGSSYVAPARGQRHLIGLLHKLAAAARLAPAAGEADVGPLLAIGWAFAKEVYPDLVRPEVNRVPGWLPLVFPRPEYLAPPALAEVLVPLLRGFSPTWRRDFARRKKLSALLSVLYGLAPGGLSLLMEDDRWFAQVAQRFLADHQVPYAVPLFDAQGRYQFASPEKVNALAAALLRCVSRGHDNELFVLLVDLLELDKHIDPLLRAVRVARARHHQVFVICPWQPGIPPPTDGPERPRRRRRAGELLPDLSEEALLRYLHKTTVSRYHQAYREVRRTFGRLGVPLVRAAAGEPAQLVLDRMDRLRVFRRRH